MRNFNFFNPKWLASLIAVCIGSLYLGGELKAQDVPEVGCACADYIYLNDPTRSSVHKYLVNADGSLTEINPGGPWLVDNSGLLPSPHGLGTDLNGYLYIGQTAGVEGSGVNKYDCDGNLVQADIFITDGQTNIFSTGNSILVNNWPEPSIDIYDACSASVIGVIEACDSTRGMWGFSINEATNTIMMNTKAGLFVGDLDAALAGACVPLLTTDEVIYNVGVTSDNNGNIYVLSGGDKIGGADGLGSTVINKYDANGNLICTIPKIDDDGIGIVYIESVDLLYVGTNSTDCISIYDPNTCEYVGTGVPNTPDVGAKAIGSNTECCPLFGNFEDNYTFCLNENENIFLIDFLPCEFICAGTWSVISNTAGTYNSCNNSYTYEQAGSGCFNYSYTPDSDNPNNLCQPFSIDVCLNLTDSPGSPEFEVTDNICEPFAVGSIELLDDCVDSVLEWSVDGGFSWSANQPAYDATTQTAILARCNDTNREQCYSTPAIGITNPNLTCPCTPISSPVLGVTDNICGDGSGSIDVLTPCGVDSTIEYSLDDGISWSTTVPAYDPIDVISVIARCASSVEPGCYSGVSDAVSSLPGVAPDAPEIGITDNVCEPSSTGSFYEVMPCEAGAVIEYSVDGGTTWSSTVPVYNPSLLMTVVARCNNEAVAGCVSVESNSVISNPELCATDVSLEKTVSPTGAVNVGETVTWTISVVNNGPSLGQGVIVSDMFPDCLSYVGNVPSMGSFDSGSLVWTVGDLLVGQTETLELTTTVDEVGICENSAVVSMNTEDSDPSNNEDDEETEGILIDLSLTKTANVTVINVGEQFDYTLEVCNDTDIAGGLIYDASGVSVFDQLPGNVSYLTHLASLGTYSASTGEWLVGDMLNGSCEQLVITVQVDLPGTFDNTGQVSAADQPDVDSTPSNDDESEDDQETVPVTGEQIDLELDKSIVGNVTEVNVGDELTYLLVLENKGPSVATGVIVSDNLPMEVSYVSAVADQGSYDSASGEWVVGTVGVGEVLTLEITVLVDDESESITNVSEVEAADQPDIDSEPGNDDGDQSEDEEDSVTINSEAADLELNKSVSSTTVNVGDEVVFTLTLENQGGSAAGMVEVLDELPDCVEYVSYEGSDPSDVYNPFTGVWTVGDISVGEEVTMEIVVRVLSVGSCINVAEVINSDKPDLDSTPDNDVPEEDDQDDEEIEGILIDLELTKVGSVGSGDLVLVGDVIDYTLEVCNIMDVSIPLIYDATGVSVFDELPVGLGYLSSVSSSGVYNPNTNEWVIGTLANGSCEQLVITVEVLSSGDILNVAQVSSANEPDIDSDPNNDDGDQSEDEEDSHVFTATEEIDLELSKTVDATGVVSLGQPVTFTIEIINLGPSEATGVSVEDELLDCLNYLSSSASLGSYNSGSGIWTIGSIPAGQSERLDITVVGTELGACENVAQVASANEPDIDSDPNNDDGDQSEDEEDPEVIIFDDEQIDLELSKVVNTATANVGDIVTFTISLTNIGPDDGTGIAVTDYLPANMTLISSTPSQGSYNDFLNIWTVGSLDAGQTEVLTLEVRIDAPGYFDNVAEVTAQNEGDIDSDPNNDDGDQSEDDEDNAVVETPEVLAIDLELVKNVVGPTTGYIPGDLVTFELVLTNQGPDPATGIIVSDPSVIGLTYYSDSPSVGSYNVSTNEWVLSPGVSLLAGQSESLLITYVVSAEGSLRNVAEVSAHNEDDIDSDPDNDDGDQSEDDEDSASITTDLEEVSDLELSKDINLSSVEAGSTVIYTIVLENKGPDGTTNVIVEDELPFGLTYISSSATQGTYSPGSNQWLVGTMLNGQLEALTITAQVAGDLPAGTVLINEAEVVNSDTPDIDSTPDNDDPTEDDQEDVPLTVIDDLFVDIELDKTSATNLVETGDVFTYTILVENKGPATATNVSVTDQLPAGLSYQTNSASQGFYLSGTGEWTVGTLLAGQVETLDITVLVSTTATSGTIVNVAQVSGHDQTDIDSFPNNDDGDQSEDEEDKHSVTLIGDPGGDPVIDLELVKTVNTGTYGVGDAITYTIMLVNNGPDTATGVSVSDQLPAGLSYVSGFASQGNYSSSTGIWTVGTLFNGQTETLMITATVISDLGIIRNVSEVVSANETDIDSFPNNDDGDQSEDDESGVSIIPADGFLVSDLELTKDVNAGTVSVDDVITYTIVLENKGPENTNGVTVWDQLPAGLTYINAIASQGFYDLSTSTWTVGSMLNGQAETLTITASVNGSVLGPILNVAEVLSSSMDDIDSTPGNDDGDQSEDEEDNALITVIDDNAVLDLELEKSVDQSEVNVGDMVTFTISVFNNGANSTIAGSGVMVSDILPQGLSYVGYSASSGNYNSSTGQWSIGTLGINGTATLTIMATVDAGGTYENVAQVTSANEPDVDSTPGNDDGDQSEDDEDNAIVSAEQIDLEVSKVGNTVSASNGDLVTYTIEVVNYGPDMATNVQLTEHIPAGLSYVSHGTSQGGFGIVSNVWTVGSLGVGQVESLTLTLEVLDINDANNVVEVSNADQPDVDSTPDNDDGDQSEDDEDSYDINPSYADLYLEKSVNSSVVSVGDAVTFTIAVCNNGGSNATGVVANDLIPPGITYVSYSSSVGSYSPLTGDWMIGGILAGSCQTIDITGIVTGSGSFTNTAEIVSSDQPDPDSTPDNDDPTEDDQDEATVRAEQIDLELTKVSDATIIAQGGTMTYSLEVTNLGPDIATGVAVTDYLPAGITYVSSSANSGFYNPGTGVWTVGTLGVNGSATLDILVQVNGTVGGTIINVAEVTDADQPDVDSTPDNGDANEDDQDNVPVTVTDDPVIDLELLKEVNANVVKLGDVVRYTIYVRNNSLNTATGVSVDDLLPSGLSYVGNNPSQGIYNNFSGEWSIGTMLGGAVVFLEIDAVVTSTGTIVNIAEVSNANEPDVDSTPGNDDGDQSEDEEDRVEILSSDEVVDLSLDKYSTSDFVEVGQIIDYIIEVRNDGPDIATGIEISDELPSGLSYVGGFASSGSYDPSTSVWSIGTIFVGFTETLTLQVRVDALGEFINIAEVTAVDQPDVDSTPDNEDPSEDDWDDHVIVGIGDVADVSLDKGVSNPTPQVGEVIVYTIAITNEGPNMATGVEVFEQLPAGLSYVGWSSTFGTYNVGTSTWTVGSIPVGQVYELFIEAEVVGSGTIVNIAQVSSQNEPDIDSEPNNNDPSEDDQDDEPIYVGDEIADLELSKVANAQTVKLLDTVSYSLLLTNNGPYEATNVEVFDLLPACLDFVGWSANQGTYSNYTGLWDVGTVPMGAVYQLNIDAIVTCDGPITNMAQVSSSDQEDPDSTPNNDDPTEDDQDEVTIETEEILVDLELDKLVSVNQATVGEEIEYTIVVTNQGPDNASGVSVYEFLPYGLTYTGHNSSRGTYNPFTGLWNIGGVNAFSFETLNIRAIVDIEEPIINIAEIVSQDQTDVDSSPNNNAEEEDDQDEAVINSPNEEIDLWLEKSVDVSTVSIGDIVTYTIALTNDGPNGATGVVVSDNLPPTLTYAGSSSTAGVYTAGTGMWSVGNVGVGQTVYLYIQAQVMDDGNTLNVAQVVAADQPDVDSDPANNDPNEDDQDDAGISGGGQGTADLSVDKTADVSTAMLGDVVNYTIVLTNAGPADATNVVVSEELPSCLSYVSSSSSDGSYNAGSGLWTVPFISALDSMELRISATINCTGDIVNSVEIRESDQDDPDSEVDNDDREEDDQDDVPISVGDEYADLSLEKQTSTTVVAQGDAVTYLIVVSNSGPNTATGVSVFEQLPSGMVYSTSTVSQGGYNPTTGVWTIGSIANGGQATLELTGMVLDITGDLLNTAEVISSDQIDPDSDANNDDPSEDDQDSVGLGTSPGQVDLELEKITDVNLVNVGDFVTYTLELVNHGPNTATNIVVEDLLPGGLVYSSHIASGGTTYNSTVGTWGVLSLPSGMVETLQITAMVEGLGMIENMAEVIGVDQEDVDSEPNNDALGEDDQDNETIFSEPTPGLCPEIGMYVFCDINLDGVMDPEDSGIADAIVTLVFPNGQSIDSETNGMGYASFNNIPSGSGYTAIVSEGPDDAQLTTPQLYDLVLAGPGMCPTVFFGYECEGLEVEIGNYVFIDEDGDGIQDAGEPGVPGVTVNLYDDEGNLMDTTTTDGNGEYSFEVDPNEDYVIEFPTTVPGGESGITVSDAGVDDAIDSDADSNGNISVSVGTMDDYSFDVGYIPGCDAGTWTSETLCSYVMSNPTSSLALADCDDGGVSNIEECEDGGDPLDPSDDGVQIGNYVFIDEDGDGVQDAGDTPVSGVTVNLYDASGNLIDSTVTDGNGEYYFTVDANSTYVVEFPVNVPGGNGFTTTNTGGNDATDNDASGNGQVIVSVGTQDDFTIDAGYLGSEEDTVMIGNYVFIDEDGDGVQDAGDTPVSGVTVNLYDTAGNLIDSTVTDGNGEYYFTVDANSTYVVEFPVNVPGGNGFTTTNAGSNDGTDSDVSGNGQVIVSVGTQDDFTIDAGYLSGEVVGNCDNPIDLPGFEECTRPMTTITICPEYIGSYTIDHVESLYHCAVELLPNGCFNYTPLPGMEMVGSDILDVYFIGADGECYHQQVTVAIGSCEQTCADFIGDPSGLCAYVMANPGSALAFADCDNGSVPNLTECQNGGNPLDPADDIIDCSDFIGDGAGLCAYVMANPNSPLAFADCDNGGINNITECQTGGDPLNPVDDVNDPCDSPMSCGPLSICTQPMTAVELCFTDCLAGSISIIDVESTYYCSLEDMGNGCVSYTPLPGMENVGMDQVIATVSNGSECYIVTYNISISSSCGNTPPIAVDDTASSDGDPVTIPVMVNDSDPDGDGIVVCDYNQPLNGTVALVSGSFVYTPNAGFSGTDSFMYTICDEDGAQSTATVTVNVSNPDPCASPVSCNLSVCTLPMTEIVICFDECGPLNGGNAVIQYANSTYNCSLEDGAGGCINYIPLPGMENVGSDQVTLQISDGEHCYNVTVDIEISDCGTNTPPIAVDDTAISDGGSVTIPVMGNDSDPDGDAITVCDYDQPSNGTVALVSGSFVYTPNAGFEGVDTFTYTICDEDGAQSTATVTVNVSNPDPCASPVSCNLSVCTLPMTEIVICFDECGPLNGGNAVIQYANSTYNCSLEEGAGGCINYIPLPGMETVGSDQVTLQISDGSHCYNVTVDIEISDCGTNTPPVANNDTSSSDGSPVTITVLVNDSDADGDMLTVCDYDQPYNGSVSLVGGQFVYTPDAGFSGTDSFMYTICDDNGGSDTAVVTISVAGNDDPVATPDAESTDGDSPLTINVLVNDSDSDGDMLTVCDYDQPNNGSVSLVGGSFVYTPNGGFTGIDTFMYTICDGNGGSDTTTVTVTVQEPMLPPVANDDGATTEGGDPVTINVLTNDSDPEGESITVTNYTQPSNGSVSLLGDSFVYTPNADFTGTDTFTYTITDEDGLTDTAVVTIVVMDCANAPESYCTAPMTPLVICPFFCEFEAGYTIYIDYEITDLSSLYGCSTSILSEECFRYMPLPGFVGMDEVIVSAINSAGEMAQTSVFVEVSESCEVSGGSGDCLSAGTACDDGEAITVNDVEDGNCNCAGTLVNTVGSVSASNDAYSTVDNQSITVDVLVNDSYDCGAPSIAIISSPSSGGVLVTAAGIIYIPEFGGTGSYDFIYEVCCGSDCSQATVSMNVLSHDAVNNGHLRMPNAITPNGDGINDAIDMMEVLDGMVPAGTSLEIFDQNGKVVFSEVVNGLLPQWSGKTKSNADLPNGTYYYMLEVTLEGGVQQQAGFIEVRR